MAAGDQKSEQDLLNRFWDNKTGCMQTYLTKFPLLNDGANTAGTGYMTGFNGTWAGTFSGTFLLPANYPAGWGNLGTFGTKSGTLNFASPTGWAYVLHGLSVNTVQDTNGTLGTCRITGMRLDGVELGTAGAIASFATNYGEDLTLVGSLSVGYVVELGGTAIGSMGTWGVNVDVSGFKFRID